MAVSSTLCLLASQRAGHPSREQVPVWEHRTAVRRVARLKRLETAEPDSFSFTLAPPAHWGKPSAAVWDQCCQYQSGEPGHSGWVGSAQLHGGSGVVAWPGAGGVLTVFAKPLVSRQLAVTFTGCSDTRSCFSPIMLTRMFMRMLIATGCLPGQPVDARHTKPAVTTCALLLRSNLKAPPTHMCPTKHRGQGGAPQWSACAGACRAHRWCSKGRDHLAV